MNEWVLAAVVLIAATIPCLGVCVLAGAAHALAAFEVASTLATSVLMLLSEGFHRQPFVDLAVVLALLSIVGGLAFARLMEQDL
jgi:multisubunit Na+/H+ antiporter MnhF subunit